MEMHTSAGYGAALLALLVLGRELRRSCKGKGRSWVLAAATTVPSGPVCGPPAQVR